MMKLIWRYFQFYFLTALVCVIKSVAFIDASITGAYQRFVVDPLQFRGFSLKMQVRVCYGIASVLALFDPPIRWVNLILAVMWMVQAFFLPLRHLDEVRGEAIGRNPLAGDIFSGMLRLIMIFMAISEVALFHRMFWFFLLAAWLGSSCDPKPRKPQRIKVLIPQEAQ